MNEPKSLVERYNEAKDALEAIEVERRADTIAKAKLEQLRLSKLSAAKASEEHAYMLESRKAILQPMFDTYRLLLDRSVYEDKLVWLVCAIVASMPPFPVMPGMVFMPPTPFNQLSDNLEAIGKRKM